MKALVADAPARSTRGSSLPLCGPGLESVVLRGRRAWIAVRAVAFLCVLCAVICDHAASGVTAGLDLSCTTFMVAYGQQILFGDSEDAGMGHPLAGNPVGSCAFFRSGTGSEYGRMHLGWLWQGQYESFQAGMNDQGLAYGLTAVPEMPMNSHPERPFVHGRDSFYDRILRTAATVNEAIQQTLLFDFSSAWFQIQYADAFGDSAVLSPGSSGEWVIARKASDERVIAASTFNLAQPELFIGRDSFVRYEQIIDALAEHSTGEVSLAQVVEALRAVGRQGAYGLNQSYTMYSTIYDLTNREATVYMLCTYDEPISFDLREELARGDHRIALRDVVSTGTVTSAVRRYWATQVAGFALLSGAILGLIGVLAFLIP